MTRDTRDVLRRLVLKLCFDSNVVPQSLVLRGLVYSEKGSFSGGGFADIYRGTYRQIPVALKRLRVFQIIEESKRGKLRKVRRVYRRIQRPYHTKGLYQGIL